jgi:hypothetical protein
MIPDEVTVPALVARIAIAAALVLSTVGASHADAPDTTPPAPPIANAQAHRICGATFFESVLARTLHGLAVPTVLCLERPLDRLRGRK